MELVILAAGMGSRFGGLKQLTPVDENDNYIIDYSVYDAIAAGFDRVVFIIRKANEELFKNTIGNRIGSRIAVEYVFQENDSIPDGRISKDREKPLGTGHAILCCRDAVKEDFVIINADDFYGKGAYRVAANFIRKECSDSVYGCVCYKAGNTLTENGTVKRGVCKVENENVTEITESSLKAIDSENISAKPLDGRPEFVASFDTPVSMNMFVLSPSIFPVLEKGFDTFLINMQDPLKDEYLLPDIISSTVSSGKAELRCVNTDERWIGVTYKEDLPAVIGSIKRMIQNQEYPSNIWQ